MSQLDQAKKEAKRLFVLAQKNSENNQTKNYIEIDNLSKSREVLSFINGYKNWHEYEQVLKRKDLIFEKVDRRNSEKEEKNTIKNQEYFIQNIQFKKFIKPSFNKTNLLVDKGYKNIVLGRKKDSELFKTKKEKWILNDYPVLLTGSTGAGKTETLLSMAFQHIENNEGVIYIDGKGDVSTYSKFFSYALQNNKIEDVYCLNFMRNGLNLLNEEKNFNSHSIDPINPMVGNQEYFDNIFGKLGIIIHEILKELKQKKILINTQSLESILMLNNLIVWSKENKFLTNEIDKYLLEIGLSLNEENDDEDFSKALIKHSINAQKAFQTVKIFKQYNYILNLNCSVDMEKIFLERKILIVLLPALEKMPEEIFILGSLITAQISHIENKYKEYKTHLQNIIIDDFTYFSHNMKHIDFKQSSNHYIFGCQDFYCKNDIFNYVLNNAKTIIIMKSEDLQIDNKIKLDLINNLHDWSEIPKIKHSFMKDKNYSIIQKLEIALRSFNEGKACVFSYNTYKTNQNDIINNEYKYYCSIITCEYIPTKRENKIYLVPQEELLAIEESEVKNYFY